MFEPQRFDATPANARRLLEFNRLKGSAAANDVQELASHDVVSSRLAALGAAADEKHQAALQRVLDWNGRGMLLVDDLQVGRDFASTLCRLRSAKKILVFALPSNFGLWTEHLERELPGLSFCVFGNPRHKSSARLPAHIKFSDVPDRSADVIICNYLSAAWHDLLDGWCPEQTVVEEFSAPGAGVGSYKHKELLAGMFREISSPLFIQNVADYQAAGDLLDAEYTGRPQKLAWDIEELLDWGVWSSCGFPGRALLQRSPAAIKTMQMRGYASSDIWRLLPLLGVSTELVKPANQ